MMIANTFRQEQDSSSSNLTVESVRSDAILQLGRKIVNELGLDQSVDTLGRWMAHYVAELIQSAEDAQGDQRSAKLSRCADAILDLWRHRSMLPNGKRPLEGFEPILRALESLDPNDDAPRYFRLARLKAGEDEQDAETKQWLDLANGVDYSARILIRYCLVCAAKNAIDKSREWITLAEALDEEEPDLKVVYAINDESDLLNSPIPDESERRQLEDRIRQLDWFLEMVGALSSDLRGRTGRLSSTDTRS